MEVTAQLRVASILFLSVIVPMHWLAANTHKLVHQNWGECSIGCTIDLLHSAFVKIQSDGARTLDYDFVIYFVLSTVTCMSLKSTFPTILQTKKATLVDKFNLKTEF